MASLEARAFGPGLERAALVVLFLAALVPRLFDVAAPLDRAFDGEQGGFFAIGAINFERLGVRRTGGYPVLNIDLGDRADPATRLWDRPELWVSYANHPPTVPLIAWASRRRGMQRASCATCRRCWRSALAWNTSRCNSKAWRRASPSSAAARARIASVLNQPSSPVTEGRRHDQPACTSLAALPLLRGLQRTRVVAAPCQAVMP